MDTFFTEHIWATASEKNHVANQLTSFWKYFAFKVIFKQFTILLLNCHISLKVASIKRVKN